MAVIKYINVIKIVQFTFMEILVNKNSLPSSWFEPTTSKLIYFSPGITFLTGICISLINHFDPIGRKYSGGPGSSH